MISSQKLTAQVDIVSGQDIALEDTKKALRQIITEKNSRYSPNNILFAKVKDVFVGVLLFSTPKDSDKIILEHIEVREEMRRQRIGTALMHKMISKTKEMGRKFLFIELPEANSEILELSQEEIVENSLEKDLAKECTIQTSNLFFRKFIKENNITILEKRDMVARRYYNELQLIIK